MKTLDFRQIGVIAAVALLLSSLALADENDEVARLYRQGNLAKALQQADAYLARKPEDAQMRFQKGLILTEQKKTADAIKVFSALSKDYPDLPEPYNNLAVLYASQGQYDKARDALEAAIRTHPSYSTAHENLGDVYAKMASQAYGKALQLDKANAAAQTKLAMIKDLFTNKSQGIHTAAASVPASLPTPMPAYDKDKPAETAEKAPEPAKKTAAATPEKPVSAPAAITREPAPEKPAGEKPGGGKPAAEKTVAADNTKKIIDTVHAWAKAWSARDAGAYFSFYADDFRFSGANSRAAWEKIRQERISKPKLIEVTVTQPKVHFTDPTHARVSFRQSYRSDALKSQSSKILEMVKKEGKWLIKQERVGR